VAPTFSKLWLWERLRLVSVDRGVGPGGIRQSGVEAVLVILRRELGKIIGRPDTIDWQHHQTSVTL